MNQKAFRELHGLSQAEFARRVGIHVQSVWRYENIGRVPEPPIMDRILDVSDQAIDLESYYEQRAAMMHGSSSEAPESGCIQ